jgi:hypothetical protein
LRGNARVRSAGADREKHFFPERVLDLLEIKRGFTLVAQNLEHGRPALFRHFYATVVQLHNVHLQRLDLKMPRVPAIRARQCHALSSSPVIPDLNGLPVNTRKKRAIDRDSSLALYGMPGAERNEAFRFICQLSRSESPISNPKTDPIACSRRKQ